jgi:hypothetical protein
MNYYYKVNEVTFQKPASTKSKATTSKSALKRTCAVKWGEFWARILNKRGLFNNFGEKECRKIRNWWRGTN